MDTQKSSFRDVFVLIHAERSRQMQQHMLQDEAGGGGADPVSSLVSSTS